MSDTFLIHGASSSIGRAAMELFARRGWNVIATMRHPEEGAHLQGLGIVTGLPLRHWVQTDGESVRAVMK